MDLTDLLAPFSQRGVDLQLERLEAALAEGGHPEHHFMAVQVAGTNGKGSICTMLHSILREAGLHSGCYRSPHLLSWCERIQLDDDWIDPAVLRGDLQRWQPIGRRHALTPFEVLTAAAFDRFARTRVDVAILEVGLGGRLDATTVHPDRRVVGLAPIGMDHREFLGDTLSAIAAEKAGVMTRGGLAISGPQPPEAAAVLEARARQLGCDLRWVPPVASIEDGGWPLGLQGDHQRGNAAVAIAMAEALAHGGWPEGLAPPSPATIQKALAEVRWPGRLERRRWHGRELLVDGAHNPPAAAALRQALDRLSPGVEARSGGAPPRRWLLGIQRHKDGPELVRTLLRPGDQALVVPIPHHPSWSIPELVQGCGDMATQLHAVDDLLQGLQQLTAPDPGAAETPVVAGSLYLLGEIIPLLDPPGRGWRAAGAP